MGGGGRWKRAKQRRAKRAGSRGVASGALEAGRAVVGDSGMMAAKAKAGMVFGWQQPAGQVRAEMELGTALLRQQQDFLLRQHCMEQPAAVEAKAGANVSTSRSASSKLPSARFHAMLFKREIMGNR